MSQNNPANGNQIWGAIPVYNNGATVKDIALKCRAVLKNIVVVDDGSTDADVAELLADTDIAVLRHKRNIGKGRAIRTAARYIEAQGGEYMITIDADGQHNPEDIRKFIPLAQEDDASLIIGCRDFNTDNIPRKSRFGRRFANLWLHVETGIHIDDCQSGFRAYPVRHLNCLNLKGSYYNFEAEVLAKAAWAGLKFKTVPVEVYYPAPEKRVSHFKPFLDNLRLTHTHAMLVMRRLLPSKHKRLVAEKKNFDWEMLRHPVEFFKMLLKEHSTPESLAMSAAVGVFIATFPILFINTVLIVYVASRLHLNKVMAVNVQHLCMPPFIPMLCIEIGHYLRYGKWLTDISMETVFAQISSRMYEWFLGALIMAPVGAVWMAFVVFSAARAIRRRGARGEEEGKPVRF